MTSAFTLNTFPIDISQSSTFPWLSKIAGNFGQYKINGMIFFIRTLSSDYAGGAAQGMGSVIASVRYDVESRPPGSKSELLNSMFATSAKPSANQAVPVECAAQSTFLNILKIRQNGQVPLDPQMYSMGYLDIATVDGSTNYPGAFELYVLYDISVMKPRTDIPPGGPLLFMDLKSQLLAANPLDPLKDSINVKQPRINTLGVVLDKDLATIWFPLNTPRGSVYMITWVSGLSVATVPNCSVPNIIAANGMVVTGVFNDQVQFSIKSPSTAVNSGCSSVTEVLFVKYDGSGTALTLPYLQFGYTAVGTVMNLPGTLSISLVDLRVASGLTSIPSPVYTREDFFFYLCDCVAGRTATSPPPGRERLVDWCRQFSKTLDWNVSTPLIRGEAPFDYTIVEALAEMSKYTSVVHSRAIQIEEKLEHAASPSDPLPVETAYEQVIVPRPLPPSIEIPPLRSSRLGFY